MKSIPDHKICDVCRNKVDKPTKLGANNNDISVEDIDSDSDVAITDLEVSVFK